MNRRLLRNVHDKVVAGVSSGIAEYMEVDVTIIRLLFVLSTIFLFGTGILVYLIMWIIVPANNDPAARFSKFNDYFKTPVSPFNSGAAVNPEPVNAEAADQAQNTAPNWSSSSFNTSDFKAAMSQEPLKGYPKNNETGRTVAGLFLLVIGVYFLLNEFDIIPFWFSLRKLWPLVFVAIGVSFILKSKRKNAWQEWKTKLDENTEDLKQDKGTESTTDNTL